MKRCPKCQTYYTDEDQFCKKCGAQLETVAELPKKEKKKKPVLIIALCALFAVGLLIGLLLGRGQTDKKADEPQTEQTDKKSEKKTDKQASDDQKKDTSDDKKEDKKAEEENVYEAEWCSFSYPEAWVGKVNIEENAYEKIRCISISMKDCDEYGGLLYQIDLSDYPFSEDPSDDVYYNPGYMETLDVSTTGVYAHLVQPTDVQFPPEKQEEYMKLYNQDLSIIRDTFEFNY